MQILKSTYDIPAKQRLLQFKDCKILEMKREVDILCNLINNTAIAATENTRQYKSHRFRNSWIHFLQHVILDNNGCLEIDWVQRVEQWVSSWRGYETVANEFQL